MGTPVFVGNSHQSWEEAGQGLGDLLTVVASSRHPSPQTQSWGGKKRLKREIPGLMAKPPPIFIAGELEICLSLSILRRWTLRGSREEEESHTGCPNPTLMAMPGLPWASAGLPQGPGNPRVSVPLRLALFFKGNHNHPPPPPKKKKKQGAQAWAQWSLEVGSASKSKQNFLLEEKVRFGGRGDLKQ